MRYRVLIVDDEQDVVNVLKEMLAVLGYQADGVTSSVRAIELVTSNRYDLVIADLIMPEKTGLDIFREVKSIDREIPVIFTAGVNLAEADCDFIREKSSDFIQKPFTLKAIEAKLGEYLIPQNNGAMRTALDRPRKQ